MEVAKLNFLEIPVPDPGTFSLDNTPGAATGNPTEHNVQNPTTKSSNYTQTDKRYSPRTISGSSNMTKTAAKGILALDAAIYGYQIASGLSYKDDMRKTKQHLNVFRNAVTLVDDAITKGMIPKKYLNQRNILDIINVVYQGENTTDDMEIMKIGIDILKENDLYDPEYILPGKYKYR